MGNASQVPGSCLCPSRWRSLLLRLSSRGAVTPHAWTWKGCPWRAMRREIPLFLYKAATRTWKRKHPSSHPVLLLRWKVFAEKRSWCRFLFLIRKRIKPPVPPSAFNWTAKLVLGIIGWERQSSRGKSLLNPSQHRRAEPRWEGARCPLSSQPAP